jgi:hypothetical protein
MSQTYVTLTYNGIEKALADWGISTWRREVLNQAGDSFGFDLVAATDAPEIFPYGAQITVRIGRVAPPVLSGNPTLPAVNATGFTGGRIWFIGYRVHDSRAGSAHLEQLQYKFAGPWEFFFERLTFQKLWLTWNGVKQVADWRSQIVLGMSVTALSGAGDTVQGTTTTNLLSISQQLREIAAFVVAASAYEQSVNGLGWTPGAQLQFDPLDSDVNGNYLLHPAPGPYCLIPDYVPGTSALAGQTSASVLPQGSLMLRAPLDAVNDITCAEAFRKMVRWIGAIGSPVIWFDYTHTPPALKVCTRDQLPAISLAFPPSLPSSTFVQNPAASINIQRRDDLIPTAIAFKYRQSGVVFSQDYTTVTNDIAASVNGATVEGIGITGLLTNLSGSPLASATQTALQQAALRFGAQLATFDFEGASVNASKATIACTPLSNGVTTDPGANAAALAFWTELFPEFKRAQNLRFYNAGSPAPFLSAVDANGDTITSSSGTITVNGVNYSYILADGQVAPWMTAGAPPNQVQGSVIEATVTAYFSCQEFAEPAAGGAPVQTGSVSYIEKNCTLKLTNLPASTYSSAPNVSGGEPLPYGLAGYVFNIEIIPQYEGQFTIQEQDVTDLCPIGNNLNLTGSLAEWASMNACVQRISYDDTGKTTLNFGPATHLGAGDLIERLRVNRGPRWVYLYGQNLTNAQGGSGGPIQLGQNLPKQSASPGTRSPMQQIFPSNLADAQTNAYPNGLAPGLLLDAAPNGAGNTATAGPGQGPSLIVMAGSAGNQGSFIRLSLPDGAAVLAALGYSGAIAWVLRPVPCCENSVQGYRIILSSQFFPAIAGTNLANIVNK